MPCWPTPEEAVRIEAAHPCKMVVDTSIPGLKIRRPAARGEVPDAEYAGLVRGRCVFFDGGCKLHAEGLKPFEGRYSHHSIDLDTAREIRQYVASRWAPCSS
jgi:hypothetical protein